MSNEEIIVIIKKTSAIELIAIRKKAILLNEKKLVEMINNHLLLK